MNLVIRVNVKKWWEAMSFIQRYMLMLVYYYHITRKPESICQFKKQF